EGGCLHSGCSQEVYRCTGKCRDHERRRTDSNATLTARNFRRLGYGGDWNRCSTPGNLVERCRIRSLTAPRIRCLQPRQCSVVCTDTWPGKNESAPVLRPSTTSRM